MSSRNAIPLICALLFFSSADRARASSPPSDGDQIPEVWKIGLILIVVFGDGSGLTNKLPEPAFRRVSFIGPQRAQINVGLHIGASRVIYECFYEDDQAEACNGQAFLEPRVQFAWDDGWSELRLTLSVLVWRENVYHQLEEHGYDFTRTGEQTTRPVPSLGFGFAW